MQKGIVLKDLEVTIKVGSLSLQQSNREGNLTMPMVRQAICEQFDRLAECLFKDKDNGIVTETGEVDQSARLLISIDSLTQLVEKTADIVRQEMQGKQEQDAGNDCPNEGKEGD